MRAVGLVVIVLILTGGASRAQGTADTAQPAIVARPEPGVWIAAQPDLGALDAWAAAGVGVVVNSRTRAETAALPFDFPAAVRARGMRYVEIPIGGAQGYRPGAAAQLERILHNETSIAVLQCRSGNRSLHLYAAHQVQIGALALDDLHRINGHRPLRRNDVEGLLGP